MSRQDTIEVEGRVVEALPNTVFRVELPNGHRVLSHVAERDRSKFAGLQPGDKVTLMMTPYDLSQGRIVSAGQ